MISILSGVVDPGRVILAHDWLTGMRGGERVLETLCQAFPAAPIYTLLYRPDRVSDAIRRHPVTASWLQHVPGIGRAYRYFLPLFPGAIERLRPVPADLLISTSHCVAKGVRPPPGALHVCYCFTPMRYAWMFHEEYFGTHPLKRAVLNPCLRRLRDWDRAASDRVHHFVALSRHVRDRIRRFYGREADVVHPPVRTDFWTPAPGNARPEYPTYDLVVSALVPYKRINLAVRAYTRLGFPLRVVGTGPEFRSLRREAGPNVVFLGRRSDHDLRDLYRQCRLLVFPGEEDFGLVPVEAQACGRPVVAFARGGALETVEEGRTGVCFREQSVESLLGAVETAAAARWDPAAIRARAERFNEQAFLDGLAASLARAAAAR